MKPELSQTEQVEEAINDVKVALLADLAAKQKIVEVNREKTATHYALLKAKARLYDLEKSFD